MRPLAAIAIAIAAIMGANANAAIDCRMPNGKTVTFRSAAQCPPDAAQVDAAGKVIRPPRVQPAAPAKPSAPAVVAAPTPAPQRAKPTAYEVALAACDQLKSRGAASECKVDSNILSTSTIDITTNEPPRTAWASCVTLASTLRKLAPDDFAARAWEMRLFSPFSGNRPIGTCQL